LKQSVSHRETLRFPIRNTLFPGVKLLVSNRVETNYEIALLILLDGDAVRNKTMCGWTCSNQYWSKQSHVLDLLKSLTSFHCM